MNKSDTIAIIRSLLSSTKSKYSVCRLNVDFKKETGMDIPLFGYGNLSDFLHSIPDTVKVSGMYPIQQVHLVKNEKSSHITSLVSRTKVPDKKNRGHSRRTTMNNGFRNGKIQHSSNIGLSDLERFRGVNVSSVTNSHTENSAPTCLKSYDVSLKNFLGPDERIPPIDIKCHAQVGKYVEVCPSQIYNPYKFYFHFRKFKRKFRDFMDKMQSFYETNENIPQLTDTVIKPKQICAVFFKIHKKYMWFRGEVTRITSSSHVHVIFIDYGCRADVSKENMKFLHRDFSSLPKQAVLGSLANIRPSGDESKWSSDAVKRFSVLACEKDLIAGVVAMDAEACSMSVALSCTKGLEFHINDTLVKEGYAEFVTDSLNNYTVGNVKTPVTEQSWKSSIRKTDPIITKKDYTKEDVLKSRTNHVSLAFETSIFYFSSSLSDNKRLQKMFSAVE